MSDRRRKRRERKPTTTVKPDSDVSGLLRVLRPRKASGGKVTLQEYALRNRAA